jgi:hypothetical protein
VWRKY